MFLSVGQFGRYFVRKCCKKLTTKRCQFASITPSVANASIRLFSTSSSTTNEAKNAGTSYDPYNRYRTWSLTEDVWTELQTENARTRKAIDVKLYEQILDEMCQSFAEIAPPVPELGPTGKHSYTFGPSSGGMGEQAPRMLYTRRKTKSPSSSETVLDLSVEEYQNIKAMTLSVNETLVACLLSESERLSSPRLLVRNIDQSLEANPAINNATNPRAAKNDSFQIASVEWGAIQDNGHHPLYLLTEDTLGRPSAVWVCTVDPRSLQVSPSECLLHFEDPAIIVDVQRTKGCRYVSIQATTKTQNEVFLHGKVTEPPLLVRASEDGVLCHIDVGTDNDVFVLASRTDSSFKGCSVGALPLGMELSLFETTISSLPLREDEFGTLISGAQEGFVVVDMDIFKDFIALYERSTEDGIQRIRVHGRPGSSVKNQIIPFADPDSGCSMVAPGGNIHYHATTVRFCVENPANPGHVYECDVRTGHVSRISDTEDTPKEECAEYKNERVLVTSKDGTQVPLSLIYRQDLKADTRPAVLFGYGSYGEPMNLSFDPSLKPLFDRGFVLAYAHTRGGGDLGRSWYERGRLYQKEKAIEDYVACAKALTAELGITAPQRLTAEAFSAGGVVVGAAVNRHPELFGSVVLTNAFLDVQQTMHNDGLPITEHEWEEYGNPRDDPKAAKAIASYCPVSNATAKKNNPRFLIIGAFDDKNVPFWNAFVYALKLRIKNSLRSQVYVHIATHGGHHFRGDRLDIAALKTTFILGNRAELLGMLMNPYVVWDDEET